MDNNQFLYLFFSINHDFWSSPQLIVNPENFLKMWVTLHQKVTRLSPRMKNMYIVLLCLHGKLEIEALNFHHDVIFFPFI